LDVHINGMAPREEREEKEGKRKSYRGAKVRPSEVWVWQKGLIRGTAALFQIVDEIGRGRSKRLPAFADLTP